MSGIKNVNEKKLCLFASIVGTKQGRVYCEGMRGGGRRRDMHRKAIREKGRESGAVSQ